MKIGTIIRKYQLLIAVVIVVVAVALIINQNPLVFNFNQSQDSALPEGYGGNTNINVNVPTAAPNNLKPTSLAVTVSPNDAPRGSTVTGSVTSNGYNYPITIHAKHVGANSEVSFGGLLTDYGKFYHMQQMDICGRWSFWVTCDGVTSNVAYATITGIMLYSDETTYSRSFDHVGNWKIYSSVTGSCSVFVNDPAHGVSVPMGSVNVNAGGYASVDLDFGSLSLGNYEVDCVIGGQKASDYAGSVEIQVIR